MMSRRRPRQSSTGPFRGSKRTKYGNDENRNFLNTSRRSSVVGKHHRKKKDTRNHKNDLSRNADAILGYANEHNYGEMLSKQQIMRPSSELVKNISLFLFCEVNPSFRFARFEEDFPAFFNSLGYPFAINSSYLKSANSQFSWPPILGALAWLVDLLNYQKAAAEEKSFDEEGSSSSSSSVSKGSGTEGDMKYEMIMEEYDRYFNGEDLEILGEDLAKRFDSIRLDLQNEIDAMGTHREEMEAQRERFKGPEWSIGEQKKKLALLQKDADQSQQYLRKIEEERKKVTQQSVDSQEVARKICQDLIETNLERELITKQLEKQNLSPEDIQSIKRETNVYRATIDTLNEEDSRVNEELDQQKKKLVEIRQGVEKGVNAINELLLRVELAPKGAKYAYGSDYQLRLTSEVNFDVSADNDKIIYGISNFDKSFDPILLELKQQLQTDIAGFKDEIWNLKKAHEDIDSMKAQLENEIESQEKRLAIFQAADKKKKEEWHEKMQKQLQLLDQVELDMFHMSGDKAVGLLKHEVQDATEKVEVQKREFEEEQRMLNDVILAKLAAIRADKIFVGGLLDKDQAMCEKASTRIDEIDDDDFNEE